MTQLTYQSTNIRSLLKQVMASAESKNISDSNWCSIGIKKQERQCADGSTQLQHMLYAVTQQPTFFMGVSMPLSTDEVETDGNEVSIQTRDLDTALASFGQQMVTMKITDDLQVQLTSRMAEDEMHPVKTIYLSGSDLDIGILPTLNSCRCELPSMQLLLDGLRSTVQIASTRGNGPTMQGVHVTLDPEYLRIESANPCVQACMHYDAPWTQPPATHSEHVLSTDAARHLISALNTLGTSAALMIDTQDELMMMQTEGVYFEG